MLILLLSGIIILFALMLIRLWLSQKTYNPKIKPEPLLNFINPTHILYGNKPPRLGGILEPMPLEQFEKNEKIIWINSPVAYRNTLQYLSRDPDNYDKNLIHEFNHFAICEIHPSVGKGVFATAFIKKETVIGLYAGILDIAYKKPTGYNLYCGETGDLFFYDAVRYRNITSYIQHAPKETTLPVATANVKSYVTVQRGIPLSYFVVTRDIEPHEQLLFDYGNHYWEGKPFLFFDKNGNITPSAEPNSQS